MIKLTNILNEVKKRIDNIRESNDNDIDLSDTPEFKYNKEAMAMVAEYGTLKYVDKSSIKYASDDGGVYLEFDMIIPKDQIPEQDTFEDAQRYFQREYGGMRTSGAGQYYTRAWIIVDEDKENWIVSIHVSTGWDV